MLWAPPGRLAWLDEDIARWDVLLSPNVASTPRLRKAFGFDGPVLETGYPRNDVLSAPGDEEARRRVRADLGLTEDVVAVLYAPTWRDDEGYRDDGSPVAMGLHLARASAALGADVRILVRLHDLVTGRWRSEGTAGVVDVSYHPDIADLYLAADILVTDYSSVMFDFAVTGKPIIFFAYDLEHYRNEQRGLYFDLEPVAPGPIVRTTDAVVAAIVDREEVAAAYAERYAVFRRTFCSLEDGRATQRVVAQVIEPLL